MDFSGIQKGVHDVWHFLFPALVIVILLTLIAAWLAREPFAALGRRLSQAQNKVWGNRALYKALRRFELIKLIPLIALFLIVFALYVTRQTAARVGGVIPGRVIYTGGPLMTHTTNSDDLTRVWACFPTIDNVDTLAQAVRQNLDASEGGAQAGALASVRQWRDGQGRAAQGLDIVKSLMLWSLACALAGLYWTRRYRPTLPRTSSYRRTLGRLVLCLLLLTAAAAHYVAKQVYAIEQTSFAEASAAQIIIVPAASKATPFTEDVLKAAGEKARREYAGGNQYPARDDWWSFRFLDSHYFSWIRRTFFAS